LEKAMEKENLSVERRREMKGKLFWVVFLAAALLGMGASAWAAPSGKITLVMDNDAPTMDPHRHAERSGVTVNWQIFDSLMYRQNDMKVVPGLAESYKVLSPTVIQVTLRKNVQFHNGEPFNAQAVKFSLERVLDPKTKSPRVSSVNWLKSVEVVDDYTVKLNLKAPHPIWMEDLMNLAMVPPGYLKEKGDSHFAENPVGTGPYKFVKWTRGQEIQMTANTKYFKGEPKIETAVIKIIPDASTRLAALLSGSVDLMRGISPEEIPVLKANPNLQVFTVPILRFQWFYLSDAMNPQSPLYKKAVRQAINYAVNVPEIVDNIVGGLGTPTVVMNPMHFGYDPNVKPYPHDPAKAKALLKEAGYPNGFEMTLHYTPVNMIKGDEVSQAIQAHLAQVGINMKLQKWSGVGYMDIVSSGRAKPAFGINWGSFGVFDGDAILTPFFRSGQQYSFFNTPELDKIIDAQRQEMDPQKRKELMSKAQQILREEAPWIFMYAFKTVEGANAKLDYKPRSDEMFAIYEIGFKK
jgi:peptide/nickel transport system substrate-binding protein